MAMSLVPPSGSAPPRPHLHPLHPHHHHHRPLHHSHTAPPPPPSAVAHARHSHAHHHHDAAAHASALYSLSALREAAVLAAAAPPSTTHSFSSGSGAAAPGSVPQPTHPLLNGKLRRGKWTPEEEEYAAATIQYFLAGVLPLQYGTTLRGYIAHILHCDPMRVSKKLVPGSFFVGVRIDPKIGRRAYYPCTSDVPGLAMRKKQAEYHLRELRGAFIDSIEREDYQERMAKRQVVSSFLENSTTTTAAPAATRPQAPPAPSHPHSHSHGIYANIEPSSAMPPRRKRSRDDSERHAPGNYGSYGHPHSRHHHQPYQPYHRQHHAPAAPHYGYGPRYSHQTSPSSYSAPSPSTTASTRSLEHPSPAPSSASSSSSTHGGLVIPRPAGLPCLTDLLKQQRAQSPSPRSISPTSPHHEVEDDTDVEEEVAGNHRTESPCAAARSSLPPLRSLPLLRSSSGEQ